MKSNIVYLAATVVFLFGPAVKATAQLKVLEGNEISFGKIYQTGERVHETVTLRNVGGENITIKSVSTSCGCTIAMLSDSVVAPGHETKIKVEFNPAGYIGEVTKYIYIASSDPRNQLISIKMVGNVAYAIQPTPSNIVFYSVKPGRLDSTSITLNNTTDQTIRITKVETPSKELTYKLKKEVLKPGEYTDLNFYLHPKDATNFNGYVTIMTTSELQPVLQIRVFAGIIQR